MGFAKQDHLVLAHRPRLPSAGQLHAASQHHIEQMLFQKKSPAFASSYDALVYDAATVEP